MIEWEDKYSFDISKIDEEHHDFNMTTIANLRKVIKGDYQITNEKLEYLKRWFVNHIQGTDKKYIDCFKKNGLK
jgi:hemerythrin